MISKTKIHGLLLIKPKVFTDDRGYFFEPFNNSFFSEKIGKINFVQDNESESSKGVLRGFHFQKPPFAQSKLVRCIKGEVLDIALDLRKNSTTYGKYEKFVLSEKNKHQLFIPKGFAHAFLVLSNKAIFSYKVDNYYAPSHDSGIKWNDPELSIDWGIDEESLIISEKDKNLSLMSEFETPFE